MISESQSQCHSLWGTRILIFWLRVRDTNWHLSLFVTFKPELRLAFNFLVCFGLSGREAGCQNVCPGVKHSQTQPVIAGPYLGEETGTGS